MHCELNKRNRQKNLNILFQEACGDGNLEKVIYYLESPELDIHANIHADNDLALILAVELNHIHVIDYILNSELYVPTHNYSNLDVYELEKIAIVDCVAKANLKVIQYLSKETKKRKTRRSGV
jgi:hypothetical protein